MPMPGRRRRAVFIRAFERLIGRAWMDESGVAAQRGLSRLARMIND